MSAFNRPAFRKRAEVTAMIERYLPRPDGWHDALSAWSASRFYPTTLSVTIERMRQEDGLDRLIAYLVDENPKIYKRARPGLRRGIGERFAAHVRFLDSIFQHVHGRERERQLAARQMPQLLPLLLLQ